MPDSIVHVVQNARAPVNAADSFAQSCLLLEQSKIDKSVMGGADALQHVCVSF